jgi:hypothetical protein
MGKRARKWRAGAIPRRYLIRLAVMLPLALPLVWLTAAVSAANIIRMIRPEAALSFMPFDARSKARAAEQQIAALRGPGPRLDEAGRLARQALERDPTIASAWRSLGLVAAVRNEADADRLFRTSEGVSRRDVPTQLWLIEDSVRRNDIPGALRHYDVALRTSDTSYDLLLPILVRALDRNGIVAPLATLLRTDPPWRRWFFVKMTEQPPAGANAARLLELAGRPESVEERALVAHLVEIYAVNRQYGSAMRIYRVLRLNPAAGSALVRNGGFDQDNQVPPLDWKLEPGGDLGAEQQRSDNGDAGRVLQVYSASGAGGVVASQLLLLPAGRYQLDARSGASSGVQPASMQWQILCAHDQAIKLVELTAPTNLAAGQGHQAEFSVPASCPAQWLALTVRADSQPEGTGGWVDSVRIRPR